MSNEVGNNGEKKKFFPQIGDDPSGKKMSYKLKRLLVFWGAFLVLILLGFLIWWVISIV